MTGKRAPASALDARAPAAESWLMWRLLYRVLLLAAWPWVHVRLRLRARREPAYAERVDERFGHVPAGVPEGCVWFHTVSAGETLAAAPLIAELAESFGQQPFLITTMTPTGSAQVRARLGHLPNVHHCYAPYDFPWAVRRFYEAAKPRLLVLMETELWPNLIHEGAHRGVPVLLVNARLSERSARGYARLGNLTRAMLADVRWIACQYTDHARRFEALGAPADRVVVHGSVKFDVTLPGDHAERVAALRERWALDGCPVWIAGSTHPGEEAVLLAVHRRLRERMPQARLILVPRHPARMDDVAALCDAAELACVRQSRPHAADPHASVILGDSMGELIYLYGAAQAAFVGGSLVDAGGHNPIEPALWGLPVAMGPAVFNFPDVVAAFRESGSLTLAADSGELTALLARWLDDAPLRARLGRLALSTVAANVGASGRLRALLESEIRAVSRASEADGRAPEVAARDAEFKV